MIRWSFLLISQYQDSPCMYLVCWVEWKVSRARCCRPLSSLPRCRWPPSLSWQPRSAPRPPGKRRRIPAPRCALLGGWPEPSYTSLTWGLHEHTRIKYLSAAYTLWTDINPQQQLLPSYFRWFHLLLLWLYMSCLYWPAAVAEGEEEHTEDDAGDSDVNADYDACSGCFALFIFHTVTWDVQHCRDTVHFSLTPPKFV